MTINAFIMDTAKYLYETGLFDITFVCDEDDAFRKKVPSYMHYHPIKMERGISLSGISAYLEMKRFFQKNQFDLVQYSTPNAAFYASMAAKHAKIPNRLYCQWGIAYVGFHGLKRTIFKQVERYICKSSTLIEPDSYGNLAFSKQEGLYGNVESRVVGFGSASGVDLDIFNLQRKKELRDLTRKEIGVEHCLVFGFVGRLDQDKGINELLQAFNACKIAHKKLIIVGPHDKKESLNQDLYEASLKDERILYTGTVTNVDYYLSAMDVFVLPSYREGFGSVVIEAEAMGLPVIATNIPGPNESVTEECGILVEKKNVEQLIGAMERLQDETLRHAYGLAGYENVKKKYDARFVKEAIKEDRLKILETKEDHK